MWPKTKNKARIRGCWAEIRAQKYLSDKGLELITKNFRSPFGEIDLIMKDKNIICFIEVRYRADESFYPAVESIDENKCRRIILTGQKYLLQHHNTGQSDYRFDIIALHGKQADVKIEWIKNAFQT